MHKLGDQIAIGLQILPGEGFIRMVDLPVEGNQFVLFAHGHVVSPALKYSVCLQNYTETFVRPYTKCAIFLQNGAKKAFFIAYFPGRLIMILYLARGAQPEYRDVLSIFFCKVWWFVFV